MTREWWNCAAAYDASVWAVRTAVRTRYLNAMGTAGYELGETWHSYDNGQSWTQRHYPSDWPPPDDATHCMTVTRIDLVRGEITVQVARRPVP